MGVAHFCETLRDRQPDIMYMQLTATGVCGEQLQKHLMCQVSERVRTGGQPSTVFTGVQAWTVEVVARAVSIGQRQGERVDRRLRHRHGSVCAHGATTSQATTDARLDSLTNAPAVHLHLAVAMLCLVCTYHPPLHHLQS